MRERCRRVEIVGERGEQLPAATSRAGRCVADDVVPTWQRALALLERRRPSNRSADGSACAASPSARSRPARRVRRTCRCRSNSWMVTKLPRLFDIFSPSTCRKPLCIQTFAMRAAPNAQQVCAISFSWCGNTRSMPPPWMSNTFFAGSSQARPPPKGRSSVAIDIAEHSMCQPGRPFGDDAARAVPARLLLLRRLPQHEIHRIALVGRDVDARARQHFVERSARERAIARRAGQRVHRRRARTARGLRRHRRRRARRGARSARSSRQMCAVARGSCVGGRQPSAATSSRYWRSVPSVTRAIASLSGRPGKSRCARALILSSTSVMLRA